MFHKNISIEKNARVLLIFSMEKRILTEEIYKLELIVDLFFHKPTLFLLKYTASLKYSKDNYGFTNMSLFEDLRTWGPFYKKKHSTLDLSIKKIIAR